MTATTEKYARIATPRYTSYPTAPHFRPNFPEATYRSWLSKLDPYEPVSLYLHVPFCRQMCWYCGCNMKLVQREGPLIDYVETLKREIALVAEAMPGRMRVSHLHWGGGTPTALTPAQITDVMAHIKGAFHVLPEAEIAIESDPRTLSNEMVDTLAALGVNRASFGVQEFDPKVQVAINRVQPPEMVAEAVGNFRKAGIEEINFDLIYGLPYQTTEKLLKTIDLATAMSPNRIALFGYAHVPWVAKNQRMIPQEALPDSAARAEQAAAAAEAIVAAGYRAIGIDHFALPDDGLSFAAREGRLRRNFQGYTDDATDTLIGFGATSIGRTPWGYVQNIPETGAWARAVTAGQLPTHKGLSFSGDDKLRGAVIERIMCDGHVDLQAMGTLFGKHARWWSSATETLEALERDGLIILTGGRLSLTTEGKPLARVVASAFDTYFASGQAKHSASL